MNDPTRNMLDATSSWITCALDSLTPEQRAAVVREVAAGGDLAVSIQVRRGATLFVCLREGSTVEVARVNIGPVRGDIVAGEAPTSIN